MTKPKQRVIHVLVDPQTYKRLLELQSKAFLDSKMSQIVRWVISRGLETIESKGEAG